MENNNEINLYFAEKLYNLGDFLNSLEVLTKLENKCESSPKEQCSIYILKSKIYNIIGKYNKELQSLDLAFQKSHELIDNCLLFDVLILKAEKAIVRGEKKTFFEKFFNVGEETRIDLLPKELPEIREKLDGSLGIQVNSNKCVDSFGNANSVIVSTNYTI